MLLAVGQLVAGSLLLLIGGEGVVRGSSRLAILARLSPLFIGLTIVSLGTSAPEMAVSVATAMRGQADIAIGNVVGSNLFNMLMIVGLSAMCIALAVDKQVTSFDVPVMIAACVAMGILGYDGKIDRLDGILLLLALLAYFVISYILGKREGSKIIEKNVEEFVGDVAGEPLQTDSLARKIAAMLLQLLILSMGIGLLVLGCDWFVAGAVSFARRFGLSEALIGLTIVSMGTSLPELVTSVAATFKGERGIAIGNAVGSTTLNILAVLGVSAVVSPVGLNVLSSIEYFDIPVMVGAAILTWVIFRTHRTVARLEGLVMVLLYCGYIGYLVVDSGALG